MADYKKYKVGITVKEPWANNISYEQLDMTLFAVENGGDGCAYVALKPNIGVRPNQDPTTWIKATQRGQSIYDYCIEYGLFVGTEEEFAQDYADAVQAAKDAAASATHVEEEVSAAEQGRVSAENARVSAESQRVSAEESRVSYEAQRSVNETGRVNAEDSRVAAENARVVAESQRVSAESTRATNEENRRAEFGGMMRDAETAIGLVDAAMTEAENVDATVDGMIVTITDRHGVSKSVNIGFDIYRTYGSVAAMNADAANVEDGKFVMIATLDPTSTENAQLWVRNNNAATSQNPFSFLSDLDQASSAAWADWMENQKPIIEADHTTAVADHTQAVSDHTNATNDHAVAGQDHTTAGTDHTQAVSDSTRAGQDHLVAEQDHTRAEGDHTTASTDHSTAQSDHTTAGTDHTTASSDHTIASGDHTTALSDHDIASGDHTTAGTDHTRAESDHTTASDDHTRAESDHTIAASDHTTASSDHGIASTDHTTAQGDHTQAGDDHTIASADHANATSDHTLAGNDHTRAESDHTTAATDHTNAVADHTQAGEDHAQYLLDHESIASKANVAPNPTEGNVAALDSGGNPVDSGIPSEKVAKTDGFYEGMGVGVAKRLEGKTDVAGSFLERTTGGDAELANGLAQLNEVQGGSVKFNQTINPTYATSTVINGITFVNNNDGTFTFSGSNTAESPVNFSISRYHFENNHKIFAKGFSNLINGMYFRFNGGSGNNAQTNNDQIITQGTSASNKNTTYIGCAVGLQIEGSVTIKPNLIDLTAIFGAGNEPATVAEFEAWLEENVGLQEYYNYTEGEVVNNNMTGIESTGFNLFNPTTGKARIIGAYSEVYGNYYGIVGTHGTLTFEDDLGNVSTITPDADGKFELDVSGYLSVADAGNDVAVFLWWDGNKTEYEDYDVEIAHLDVRHIYGKKNGTGELVQVWPTGMPKVNDIVDLLKIENGAVVAKRSLGEVDLGDITWGQRQGGVIFSDSLSDRKYANKIAFICNKYNTDKCSGWGLVQVGYCCYYYNGNSEIKYVYIKDAIHDTPPTSQDNWLSGVMLYYELETPETYTDLVYIGSEYFADNTPVTLPVNYKVDNWGVETILPKNTGTILTAKPTIKVRYAIDAVEQLNTHSDEIEDLYEGLDELDDAKANKVGDYPNMSVGSAETLKGNTISSGEYAFRKTGGSPVASGLAQIDRVKGNTLVWNQLVQNGDFSDGATGWNASNNAVFSVSNGVCTMLATEANGMVRRTINSKSGSKLYITAFVKATTNNNVFLTISGLNSVPYTNNGSWQKLSMIYSLTTDSTQFGVRDNRTSDWDDVLFTNIMAIDLTHMFGAGNEPTTVEKFEALYPLNYYAYNAGQLINNCASGIESIGFNQWDEELESGSYNTTTGEKEPYTGIIRSKNASEVLPNTSYNITIPQSSAIVILYYDSLYNYLGYVQKGNNSVVETPSNAKYIRFRMSSQYGVTYNHDICINISDASKNGTYEPYEKHTCNLNLTTLTGKLNGEGESVVVFPDGLKSAGTVFDEIKGNKAIKRVGMVDMGTFAWGILEKNGIKIFNVNTTISPVPLYARRAQPNAITSKYPVIATNYSSSFNIQDKCCSLYYQSDNDTRAIYVKDSDYSDYNTFKTAMSGVYLYYELAEPLEYTLDEELPVGYLENGGGTEKRLPEDTASVVNAPLNIDMVYPIDVVKQLQEMPQNYLSVASLDALLSTLGTACNGTFSKTWDSTNGKYTFSFTSNVEPEPEPEQQGD